MEFWLNIVHYCFYKLDYKLHLLSNKLNPFLLIGKIPAVKRKFEEQGTSQVEVVNKVWGDKRYGFGIMLSGGALAIIIFLVILSASLIVNSLLNYPVKLSWLPFALCMALAYGFCYLMVFQKDKYIKYFKKFDKWTKQEKWKYSLVSMAFIVVVIALFIYSFRFIPKL